MDLLSLLLGIGCVIATLEQPTPSAVHIAISEGGEIDIAEVVSRLAERVGLDPDSAPEHLRLPIRGLGGSLTRELLAKKLGADVSLAVEPRELVITLPSVPLDPGRREAFARGLNELARHSQAEARRRSIVYGMHARVSYRPNDPGRPTVCLVHGLNSSAEVFVHMVGPLEQAGYGVVFYEFPYNRDLDDSARAFSKDWAEFRRSQGEGRPWAIVSHSMGALLARWYVEADPAYAGDVATLIALAPPYQGSGLAHGQTLLQLMNGLKAVNGQKSQVLAHLSDGLGAAADDMLPRSAFLNDLNRRTRRAGVRYHTLAGDVGVLSPAARRQVDLQLATLGSGKGFLGGLARLASDDLRGRLDELTDGRGDGCIAVESTRLDGVADQQTIHANHLELIRAPLFYPDPGPVVSMPYILRWLEADLPVASKP
jgi:pimeloyl-ACP methyl ester carboxylesterase